MKYPKAFSLCALIAVAAATPAFSRSAPVFVTASADTVVRHVNYADLNLASFDGQRTLDHRVGTAVTDLCGEAIGGNDGGTKYKLSMMHCSAEAWNSAQPQIDRAVQRARDIAATGFSSIVAAALRISIPR